MPNENNGDGLRLGKGIKSEFQQAPTRTAYYAICILGAVFAALIVGQRFLAIHFESLGAILLMVSPFFGAHLIGAIQARNSDLGTRLSGLFVVAALFGGFASHVFWELPDRIFDPTLNRWRVLVAAFIFGSSLLMGSLILFARAVGTIRMMINEKGAVVA